MNKGSQETIFMASPMPINEAVLSGATLLPGEHEDISIDIRNLLENSDEWLATPNTNFGGRKPAELIGTPDEAMLREILRSLIYSGMA
jgi:hypothetical protein